MYKNVLPPGDHIPINVEYNEVKDECPSGVELRGVMNGMKNCQAREASGMHAEDIKGWLCGMEQEEESGNA